MRSATMILALVFSACGSDDPIVRTDTGFPRGHQGPEIRSDAGPDNRPERPDTGLSVHDSGFGDDSDGGHAQETDGGQEPREDAGEEPGEDAGFEPESDGGPVGPIPGVDRRARLLQQRTFVCGGQVMSTASFTWDQGRLTRIQQSEVDFPVFDWRITHQNGRPVSATSNLGGWNLEARWTYTGSRLATAFMGDVDDSITWSFDYDGQGRPDTMTVTEDFEGQLVEQSSEATWGEQGPESFFGTQISYDGGLPSVINDLAPVLYAPGNIVQGVQGAFGLRYHPDGALAELDLQDGCLYRFTWTDGEPVYFRGSLGLGDFAMLYDVEGRYAGDFDPATELYLVILLLLGE